MAEDNNLLDENNLLEDGVEYDIITLEDEDGVDHQFELADTLEHNGKEYVALIPLYESEDDLLEDSGELVLMTVVEEDGEEFLDPVDEDEYLEISELFTVRLGDSFDFDFDDDDDEEDQDDQDQE